MSTSIPRSRLGAMDELDRGGFGVVYRLTSHTLPGFAELAYKEFTTTPSVEEVANLTSLVEFRSRLDTRSRAVLDDVAAWPLQLVTRGRVVCGFVMQLIPAEFFGRQLLPSGLTVELPVKSQWLVVDPAKADAAGIAVPDVDDLPARLVLCAKVAHAFGVLHRAGLVYGDLSLNNVMFSAATPPRAMLVDCDAVQAPGMASIGQAHTDDWTPPECASSGVPQDAQTDRYKLALFILRVLTPGPHASQSVDPSRMDQVLDLEGNAMMRDGVSTDRAARPTAKDWFDYLSRFLTALTSPPTVSHVDVDVTAVLAGSMATVSWLTEGADRVVVTASDGHTVSCDATGGTGQVRVAVTRTGPFTLSAENRFGTTTVDSSPVFVLAPPTITRITVPPVVLPPLEIGTRQLAGALLGLRAAGPDLRGMRPGGPDLSTLRMPIPAARSAPQLAGLLEDLSNGISKLAAAAASTVTP
ncbi:MAG: hypothetical protein EKK51_27930 [Mycolicibacterium sp.]|uniref:hypothetical protein n=1 Tax=Mycolicibacterium sp. TaxID=2320850 RepID=UPI000FB4D968|nr:hypothetical protein [Mycolicibacterium sp.]RUP27141.1 MAG: hypothetical protein EKK51_27930 [Mycolicibacterium sp.]